jgi:hypothetical protein
VGAGRAEDADAAEGTEAAVEEVEVVALVTDSILKKI